MSYTEIYGFNKEGIAFFEGETKNSFRGANAIWRALESKYLPPFEPEYAEIVKKTLNITISRCSSCDDKDMKEIWDLAKDERLSRDEKIVLYTTFDNCLVKKENLQEVIDAFNNFEGETSLKEQAIILENLLNNEDVIAVGWNQTSFNGDTWEDYYYEEEKDECIPYNCLTGNEHYWLCDELKQTISIKH